MFKRDVRPRGTDSARLITVIVTKSICGIGNEADPVRTILQYWDLDGKLLAEKDEAME
jgi:hypothetical protein